MDFLAKIIRFFSGIKTHAASVAVIGAATDQFLAGNLTAEQYGAAIGASAVVSFLRMAISKVMAIVRVIASAIALLPNLPPEQKAEIEGALARLGGSPLVKK